MKEILGNNLDQFFGAGISGKRTYKGDRYEVWELSDETFAEICEMSEEKFVELAGEDAWWRSAEGSNLGFPDTIIHINGHEILAWAGEPWEDEEEEDDEFEIYAICLTKYLCDVLGASQPRNVCALAVDLAKHNSMTMADLFARYEG